MNVSLLDIDCTEQTVTSHLAHLLKLTIVSLAASENLCSDSWINASSVFSCYIRNKHKYPNLLNIQLLSQRFYI